MPASMFSNLSTESRKGYSLIEKKNILQYIIEHNAYDQVKGRSFWIQFENSKFTTRTWQSLKEVYLKRILKDLRNPYYSLSETEIRKFKTGSNAFSNLKTLKWAQKNNTSFKNRSIKNTSITSDVEKNKSSKTTDIIEKNNVSNIKDFLKPKSPVKKKNDSDIEIIPSTSQTSPILINSRDYESSVNSTSNSKENDKYSHKSSAENGDQSSESDDVLLNSQSLSNNIMPTSTPKKNKITQQLKEKQDSINPINENNNNQLGSNDNNSPKKLKERSTLSKADEIRKEFLQLFCSSEESEPEEGKLIGDNQFKTNTILNSQHVKTVDENQHETYAAKNETEKIKTVDENQHGTNAAKKETEKIKTVDENQRTANMFGFSSGMLKQTSDLKRKRFDSIEIVNTNEVRPCTSKYLSPSRPHKKTFKRERTFVDLDSTDLDSSEGSCSESDVSYYRGSEPENRKRRGSKIFGMYNGQIIPLYEPKRKCCMRRQQIILHNKRKQDKRSRKKPSVYIDHEDVQPSQMLMNQPSDKIDMGDNSACETLNYWKLKYHSKERENDFLLRFIQMLNPSSIPPSILPSTSHPMVLENVLPNNKPHNDATLNTNTNKESISTKPNLKELSPIKNDTGTNSNKDENLPPEAGNSTQTKKETVVIVPSKNSNCEINGTKYVDAKNVVVIDTQKSDILFELLKKLGDMKQPIDVNKIELSSFSNKEKNEDSPSKQKRIASKSASNAATPTQAMKTRSSKEKEIPDESRKTDIYLAKIQPVSNQDSELPKEIEKIRNKEKQIFDKILAEKTPEESNVNRKLFSSLEIDMLLYGKTNENPTDEKKTPGNTSTKQKKKSTSSSPMGTDGESDNKRQLRTRNREVKEVNNTSTKSIKSKDVQDNSTQSSENVKSNPLRKKGKNQTSAVEPGEGGSPQNSPVDRKSKSPRVSHLVKGQSFNVEENQAVNKPIIAETIDENAKFKINPKFLSKLFPTKEKVEMSKNPKKPHSDDDIVPPSSDSEAEETRYAFASSFFNSRKIKNRRSSERSVNLKWFPERKTKPINKNKTDNNV